jgi:hypothetical protein
VFEKFSEKSRRLIFFARYEASCLASPTIETEHLLLGLMRESRWLFEKTLAVPGDTLQVIRKHIEMRSAAAQGRPKLSTSVDLPLGAGVRIALNNATEEADAMQDPEIRPAHVLLALLREDEPLSQFLRDFGLVYDTARKQMAGELVEHREPAPLAPSLAPVVSRLRELLGNAARSLALIDPKPASTPLHEGGWSPKQILGHLIDSASNNHQRFVRALIQPELTWPNYEQEPWVACQAYATTGWGTLLHFWTEYNMHLLRVITHIPEEKIGTICRIGDNAPMTLGELVSGYIDHLEHHLNQILG